MIDAVKSVNLEISHRKLRISLSIPLVLAAALCCAGFLKLWLVAGGYVPFNADEAVVGLMARHILEGRWPSFFYGQAYMGSLDAILVAGAFSFIGQEVWVIRFVQGLLYLGTLLTTAVLGKEALGSWSTGVLAAWFLAIPAVNTSLYTTASLGGYGEMLLLGNLILISGMRIAKGLRSPDPQQSYWPWITVGFLSGLGVWSFGLTLVYSIPTGIYLFWMISKFVRDEISDISGRLEGWKVGILRLGSVQGLNVGRTAITSLGLLGVGVLVGAGPWWIYALQNGFGQLIAELQGEAIAGVEGPPWLAQLWKHVISLVLFGLTAAFGLRPPWEVRWLALPLLPIALMFWLVVLGYVVRRLKSGLMNNPGEGVLAGVGLCLILGFVLTPFGADPSGRYFLPLAVILALFAAQMILDWRAKWGNRVFGIVGMVLVFNLAGTIQAAVKNPPGITTQFDPVAQIDHRYDEALIEFLRGQGEYRGYTNYWVAYPLAFKSDEELVFVPRLPYHQNFRYTERDDRYAPYDALVTGSDRVAYITTHHPALNQRLRRAFAELGITWQEHQIGDFHIFYQLSRPVRPEEIGLGRST